MALEAKDLAPVGKEKHVIMGIRRRQQPDRVPLPGHYADNPLAAAMLRGVEVSWHPLNISPVAQCHHHPLVRNKVFFTER